MERSPLDECWLRVKYLMSFSISIAKDTSNTPNRLPREEFCDSYNYGNKHSCVSSSFLAQISNPTWSDAQ